jgi:hypothetical protein
MTTYKLPLVACSDQNPGRREGYRQELLLIRSLSSSQCYHFDESMQLQTATEPSIRCIFLIIQKSTNYMTMTLISHIKIPTKTKHADKRLE